MRKIFKNNWLFFLIIIGLSIVSMVPLYIIPRLGHDTYFHLSNAIIIEKSFNTFNLFPKEIICYTANNLGYGINLFYPILPHYILAIAYHFLKLFNLNIWQCMVVVLSIISVISGLLVYWLAVKLFKNKYVSLAACTIFIFFPYRLNDFIVRCAYNELYCFIFIPMILLSFIYLLENKNYLFYTLFIIGYVGLFSSHLVLSLYFTLFFIIILLINYKKVLNKNVIKEFIIASLCVVILISPFLYHVLEHKFLGNYVVYKDGLLGGINFVNAYSLDFMGLFNTNIKYDWDVITFISPLLLILNIVSFIVCLKKKNNIKASISFFGISLICLVMITKLFKWEIIPSIFYMIQFPWRLELFLAFSLSLGAVGFLKELSGKKIKYLSILIIIITCISSINILDKLSKSDYLVTDEISYDKAMGHSKEYLPLNTLKNNSYYENRNNEIKIMNGNGDITILDNEVPSLSFIGNNVDNLVIELPRLYYIGYRLIDDKKNSINLVENDKGFLQAQIFFDSTYKLEYVGSVGYQIMVIVREIFIVIIIIIGLYKFSKKIFTSHLLKKMK